MRQRAILHSDCNAFYASCEEAYNPALKARPLVVGGDPEARHGIVLAKNQLAKKYGIQTGEVLWQAKQKCPGLVTVPADYRKYLRFSALVRKIYGDYTSQIEPFGLDEAWLDVTSNGGDAATPPKIADAIRCRVREELGITVSVGVSWNKIFAKLGSDIKKPDATTVITPENYRDVVWPLPAGDLLYVGASTRRKLANIHIITIGDLAGMPRALAKAMLGINGLMLHDFANGLDGSPVAEFDTVPAIKSIGNSTTTPRDLVCDEDAKITLYLLAESVAARLREHGLKARTVEISVRDNELACFTRQTKLRSPSQLSGEIAAEALTLLRRCYGWEKPIRSLGVRGSDLVTEHGNVQLSLFEDEPARIRLEGLERAIDDLRRRYGYFSVQRGMMLQDRNLSDLNAKEDHVIHPVSFLRSP